MTPELAIELVKSLIFQAVSLATPILMTALTTGLALVPLVIGGNKPGHEIEYPLAVVILGGLCTSTVLNLFLLPPLSSAHCCAATSFVSRQLAATDFFRGPPLLGQFPKMEKQLRAKRLL